MKRTILAAMLALAVPGLANADSGKLPNLVVSDITWSTEDGVDYTIVAAVENVGNKKLTGPATISVLFEGPAVGQPQYGNVAVKSLRHHETVYASIFEDIFSPGTWEIRATVDPNNVIPESDEDDNVRVEFITK